MLVTTIYFLIVLIIIIVQSFILNKSHIIILLLVLESIMLVLLVYLFFLLTEISINPYIFLILLTLRACEAALGLSILVSLIRFHGNDFIIRITRLKW